MGQEPMRQQVIWRCLCLLGLLGASHLSAQSAFLWQGRWDGQQPASVVFHNDGVPLSLHLSPSRCQFQLNGTKVGWGEWLPPLPSMPTPVSVLRQRFRWLAFAGQRLVALAFADLPPTSQWSGFADASLQTRSFPDEQIRLPVGNWRREESEGILVLTPPEDANRRVFPLVAQEEPLTDIFVTLPVQPNGARSVGVGVCWGEEGGYLWRWVRTSEGPKWQLAVVERRTGDEGRGERGENWDLTVLHEELAPFAPTDWHRLQVWRSADQIWVGVDETVLAHIRDNRFGWGKVVVWVEPADRPPPRLQPVRIVRWTGLALSPDIDIGIPFLALRGQWQVLTERWVLQATAPKQSVVALLGESPFPAWWLADVQWQGKPIGLVFGWLSERRYYLLRLRPVRESAPVHHALLELVAVRDTREQVLDSWGVWLEPNELYRLALLLTEQKVNGFLNGLGLVSADLTPTGKVGLWALLQGILRRFWLYEGTISLVPLVPEDGGRVQPASDQPVIAHEVVAFTLPDGLPPKVPLSARLSHEPITLTVERQFHQLMFRLERENNLLGVTTMRFPSRLPLTIRLERRDRLLLVWMDNQPVWTLRLR